MCCTETFGIRAARFTCFMLLTLALLHPVHPFRVSNMGHFATATLAPSAVT
jgi:hypothetical protein